MDHRKSPDVFNMGGHPPNIGGLQRVGKPGVGAPGSCSGFALWNDSGVIAKEQREEHWFELYDLK